MSIRLVAPPGVAPGTSAVPVCAHKEQDVKELAQAERMSGATWRSRAPSIGGATPPQPNQKDMRTLGQCCLPASCLLAGAVRGE